MGDGSRGEERQMAGDFRSFTHFQFSRFNIGRNYVVSWDDDGGLTHPNLTGSLTRDTDIEYDS